MRTNQKLKLSKGPSSYPKSENMLEFSNIGHTFYTWRIDCAKKIMKKSKFLWSDYAIPPFYRYYVRSTCQLLQKYCEIATSTLIKK